MYTNWPMLSEEHISVAEMCKEFSDSEVAIGAAARDKDHTYPKELVSRMAELGLMGVDISSNYGGSDMDCLGVVDQLLDLKNKNKSS